MVFTDEGKFTEDIAAQSPNALNPMAVTLVGISAESITRQKRNALSLMDNTDVGMEIESNPLLANVWYPMADTDVGMVTEVSAAQNQNA